MTPAELADDEISSVGESVAYVNGVVASLAVIFKIFLVFCHDGAHI